MTVTKCQVTMGLCHHFKTEMWPIKMYYCQWHIINILSPVFYPTIVVAPDVSHITWVMYGIHQFNPLSAIVAIWCHIIVSLQVSCTESVHWNLDITGRNASVTGSLGQRSVFWLVDVGWMGTNCPFCQNPPIVALQEQLALRALNTFHGLWNTNRNQRRVLLAMTHHHQYPSTLCQEYFDFMMYPIILHRHIKGGVCHSSI
jgi:hypothetical protein